MDAASAAVSVADRLKTQVFDKIKARIKQSNDMHDIYNALGETQLKLTAYRTDMENQLKADNYHSKPSMWFKVWTDRIDQSVEKVQDLRTKYLEYMKATSRWCIIRRSRFSRTMKLEALDMVEIMEEDFIKHPSWSVQETPDVVYVHTHDLVSGQQRVFNTVLSLLFDKEVTGVSLFGLPGVGKTTILKNINNSRQISQEFDIIIWLFVSTEDGSRNRTNRELQQSLYVRLGIEDPNADPQRSILSKLKGKRILLLLDNVCQPLALDLIGLPLDKDCSIKLVLTQRRRSTCEQMVDRELQVDLLDKEDSHSMFTNLLGNKSFRGSDMIAEMIHEIVDICGGLPLMISVAARYFRVRGDSDSWQKALGQLRQWPKCCGTMKEAYTMLKTFFDSLDKTSQRCLFYASLYPAKMEIMGDLLCRCWEAEQLLTADTKVDETVTDYSGQEMLDSLLNIGLINADELYYRLQLHPLIRRAYLHYMEDHEDIKALVNSGGNEVPEVQNWNKSNWISITETNLDRLPDQVSCRALSTLFLQNTKLLKGFSSLFFNSMDRLVVLDVSDTNIISVPALELGSLKVLVLRNCKDVRVLPCKVGHFKNLELLDIRGTGIPTIPSDIGNLTSLKSLLVSFTSTSVDTNLLEKADCFSKDLMKVSMLDDIVVEVEESHSEMLYASLLKVLELSRLLRLRFCCPSSRNVKNLIECGKFAFRIFIYSEQMLQQCLSKIHRSTQERLMVYVGCDFKRESSQMMRFKPWCFMFKGQVSAATLTEVLRKDAALEVCNDNNIDQLWMIDNTLLNRIRGCTFKNCPKMEFVLKGKAGDGALLDNIEILHLISLKSLINIYKGEIQGLSRLETVVISECRYLRCVCPFGLLLQLPELKHLEVTRCRAVTRLFNHHPTASPVLPKLGKLILVDLPNLEVIIDRYDRWCALKHMTIVGCPKLVMLPFKTYSAANLNSIVTEKMWWDGLKNTKDIKEKFFSRCKFG